MALFSFGPLTAQEYNPAEIDLTEFETFSPSTIEVDTIQPQPLNIAIVLSDIYSKKDTEFLKGFLLGIEKSSLPSNSVSLKVVNGEVPEDSLYYELEGFDADIIFTTHERDVPPVIMNYASQYNKNIYNVFDTKGEDYLTNQYIAQLLPPSPTFNTAVASHLLDNVIDGTLLIIGEPEKSDLIIQEVLPKLSEEQYLTVTKETIKEIELEGNSNYVLYPASSNASEVKSIITDSQRLLLDYPEMNFKFIGRPNWIAYNDLSSMVTGLDVYVPAKCYFNPSSAESKKFIADYNAKFGHSPIRAFPVYSVMGYDVARYFIPLFISENYGYEQALPNMLQTRFNLKKAEESGGRYNDSGLFLHFTPWGNLEIMPIE